MGYRFIKSRDLGPLRLRISSSGVSWSVVGTVFLPAQVVARRAPAQVERPANAHPDAAHHADLKTTLLCILAGLLIGGAILGVMYFRKTLPGYTQENRIPPPPARAAQIETEVTP